MGSAAERPMALRLALDRIVAATARGLTGREVRLDLGGHPIDLVIDELELTPPRQWNGPPGPTQAAQEMVDIAFEVGEVAQRGLRNPVGFGVEAARALTASIDRWARERPDVDLTELSVAAAASVVTHKVADPRLPSAGVTASCSGIRLRSRSIVSDAIDITFSRVTVTGTATAQELTEWLRVAGIELPKWATLTIEPNEVLRLRHRRLAWRPQVVAAVGVADRTVLVEVTHIAVAGRLVMLPRSRRKRWVVTASELGTSLDIGDVATGDDMISVQARTDRWTRSMSLGQLQRLSLELARDTRLFL